MYSKQKGAIPLLTRILGLILLGYTAVVCIQLAADGVIQNRATQINYSALNFFIDVIGGVLLGIILLSPLWIIGRFFLSMFPLIRLAPEGVKYHVIIRQGLIRWNEIENIIQLKNGLNVLTISRKGSPLFNGLYFNALYRLFIRHEKPVLFLAPGLENRDKIVAEIMKMSSAKTIKQPNDLYT